MDRPFPISPPCVPRASKRSSKRDRILQVFLRQEGHLSADDLFDLVRREAAGIGRATVYRTLQWMVDAGIARKVDFGEGRSRFEPSYRHPRHFHLDLHDLSSLVGVSELRRRVADRGDRRGARSSRPTQAIVQIYGTCEECRTGRQTPPIDGATTELVFARDALRMAIATERSGLEFYTRAASLTKDPRGRSVFQKLAAEEGEHLGTLEKRYRELIAERSAARVAADVPVLQGRRQRPVRRGRRSSCARASTISRRCSSASSASAARTSSSRNTASGSRTPKASRSSSSSPTRRRAHLDLLMREYRALRERQAKTRRRAPARRARGEAPMIDLHTHTTASDGRCTPGRARRARRRGRRHRAERHRPRHRRRRATPPAAACAAAGIEFVPGIEITAVRDERRRPRARLLHRLRVAGAARVSRRAAPAPHRSRPRR